MNRVVLLIAALATVGGCRYTPAQATSLPEPPPETDSGGWQLAFEETFEGASLATSTWQPDTYPDDGPNSDKGGYFRNKGITPPAAFRSSSPFGQQGWLTLESSTRSSTSPSFASIVNDPSGATNRVLRIASPAHTDATVVRPTNPLPKRYRISLRVGYPSFGDGLPGKNGYDGGETGEPWQPTYDATEQNGFYWLAILDAIPRPHNNVWIHHHRKVVFDSDNHYPPWMEVWNGQQFVPSGEHPIMMFALDGTGTIGERIGKPFIAYSAGKWQPSGKIRAVDSYEAKRWYSVRIERDGNLYLLEISGSFRYGGQTTYKATIDAAASCVWHFNRGPGEDASKCTGTDWPANGAWPDYFMFGDPHTNYYEGEVYFDDVRLEIAR